MNDKEALDLAIFAVNTVTEPEASSAEDAKRLDDNADEVLNRLAAMRDALIEEARLKAVQVAYANTRRECVVEEGDDPADHDKHGHRYDHDARPDDDSEPGDRCKDCGEAVTWMGPGHNDWLHHDEEGA